MTTDLPKTYEPGAVEAEAYRVWIDENCFLADPSAPGEPYCIVIPPPNVTGALHLGHAINNTLQDILIRMHRMAGFNTLWIPGIDHAGIATQAVVEKQLKEKENKTRHDVGREGLVERIWAWKQQYGDRILEQLKRLGCSCDWSRTHFTLDEMCARAVRETFFKLFKDGLIYRGKRLVNWDVFLQTSVSDDEIYHETVTTSLWHIRYPIVERDDSLRAGGVGVSPTSSENQERGRDAHATNKPTHMTIATTRPETLLGDTAVAVHSEDPRWNWAIGKFVELPLTGRKIPIIADDILVDPKFGTGVVKVTPAHDPNDYAVWQRHQGKADQIDLINILTPEGKINEAGGAYAGMKRDAARKKIVEDLTQLGLLEKEEPYETQVGHSDRSKTPIEPYLSDQWFIKMAPLAEPALQVVRDGVIQFFPERHAQQYLSWLGEKRDWPISRQLWWGHRIPVWSKTFDHYSISSVYTDISDILSHSLQPPRIGFESDDIAIMIDGIKVTTDAKLLLELGLDSHASDAEVRDITVHICTQIPILDTALKTQGWLQDPDVLDTWFSSALWPHSTLGWPEDSGDLRKWYPTSVLLTGRDIITLWVARMVMAGLYNMKEIPFPHVAINPTILDGKGERMSKTKGNGVDPVEIIDGYGADALRFTLTSMATETQDVRMPVKKLADGRNTSEKFDLGRNFCNKLWNAARFALTSLESVGATLASPSSTGAPERATQASPLQGEPVDESTWSLADRWIVSRFNRAVVECDEALQIYRFDQYAKSCYDFFWRDFCDWYVEAIKPSLKDPAKSAQTAHVLTSVLDGILRLMHPMIPFITETIWWKLNEVRPNRGLPKRIECAPSKRLIHARWPTPGQFSEAAEFIFPKIQEIVGAIRNIRNEHQVGAKKSVTVSILAPGDASRQIADNRGVIELLATCKLKNVAMDLAPVTGAVRAMAAGCEIFVEAVVNEGAEKERTAKKREELKKTIAGLKGRLSNESYIAKAPPNLVQQTRDQLTDAENELKKLGDD